MYLHRLLTPATWLGFSIVALGQTASPVQSAARPYKLDITAPVQLASSDAASKAFQTNVLPGMLKLVDQRLAEYKSKGGATLSTISLDPSKLVLNYDATARVYFLGEGAGYRNTLGISTTGGGPLSSDAKLVFPDASSSGAGSFSTAGKILRTSLEPLLPGDFVDLGKFKAGTALDFFLIAYGASGGKDFFSTNSSLNSDGIVHAVSLAANGSAYLVLGFEDVKGGGDKDYNDLVFAVEIGKSNVARLSGLGAPEPSLAMGSLLAGVAFFGLSRRRQV